MWLARRGHVANSDSAGSSSCSARLQSTHAQSRASPAEQWRSSSGYAPRCRARTSSALLMPERHACATRALIQLRADTPANAARALALRASIFRGNPPPVGAGDPPAALPARCGVPSQPGRSRAARPRREHRPLDWKAGVPPQQVHAANANDELVEPVALGDLVPRAHPGGLGAARRRAHQDVPLSDEGAPARAAELRAFTTGGWRPCGSRDSFWMTRSAVLGLPTSEHA